MVTLGKTHAARNLIVPIGQSLNGQVGTSTSLYGLLKTYYQGRARIVQGFIFGIGWLQWTRDDWAQFYTQWAPKAERVIFPMIGGSTDYSTIANRTGAQCYTDQVAISARLRALGSHVRVIGATTNPGADMTGARTSVSAAGAGTNLGTFAGAGVLQVRSVAANGFGASAFAASGSVSIGMGTTIATVSYTATGGGGTTLTGCTLTSGSGILAEGMQVAQGGNAENGMVAGNKLVMADASGAFDRVHDPASVVGLDDPNNGTYYSDGTHQTAAGALLMFQNEFPHIDALLLPQ